MSTQLYSSPVSLYGDLEEPRLMQAAAEGLVLGAVRLRKKIGEGGVGSVYLGVHTRLNFPVAVKVLKEPSENNLPQFLREARLTVSVDHPNLVRVLDVNFDEATRAHYIVMEYVEGCSLFHLTQQSGRPAVPECLRIIRDSARAVGAAHSAGIVHCDIKPENILIRTLDKRVKVADLGFAGRWRAPAPAGRRSMVLSAPDAREYLAHTKEVAGTTGFLAPEVLLGESAMPASDVYALGTTLYELLTGVLPFGSPYDQSYYVRQLDGPAPDPRSLVASLPAEVCALVLRCLEADPARRFRDANMLADELDLLIAAWSQPAAEAPASLPAGPATDSCRRPVVLCVDDDEGVLGVLAQMLEENGFQPVCFNSAQKALESLPLVKPDVTVLDLMMPGMNGIELCRNLRAQPGYHDLAVLILSGADSPQAHSQAMEQGITDYLVKPVHTRELVVRVRLLSKLRAMNVERSAIETQLLKLKRKSDSATISNREFQVA